MVADNNNKTQNQQEVNKKHLLGKSGGAGNKAGYRAISSALPS